MADMKNSKESVVQALKKICELYNEKKEKKADVMDYEFNMAVLDEHFD